MPTPTSVKGFLTDDRGLETVEYAIIAGLIVSGVVALAIAIGVWVKARYNALKASVGA